MKRRLSCLTFVSLCVLSGCGRHEPASAKPDKPAAAAKLGDGFYVVLRQGDSAVEVGPLGDGEAALVQDYRYLKEKQSPKFLVVRTRPDVPLALARPPERAEEAGTLRILLELTPAGADALERVTRANKDGHAAVIIGGEVVTTHKIRQAITGGKLQISNCDPDAGQFLWRQLQALAGPVK